MVVSVLISLLILCALSVSELDRIEYSVYHKKKQRVLDLHSAAALYCADSLLMKGDASVKLSLFGTEESEVSILVRKWGLYEVMTATCGDLPFSRSCIFGRSSDCPYEAALWVSDMNRALSMAGESVVSGPVFVPVSGINYTEINGYPFKGACISEDFISVSSSRLPEVDSASVEYIDSVRRLSSQAWYYLNNGEGYQSFSEETLLSYGRSGDRAYRLGGNRILFADNLTIDKESQMDDILVFARAVTIESGFRGSMQVFCTDTIIVKKDVRLEFPSGVFVSGSKHPFISLATDSIVAGYVVVLTEGEADKQLLYPCLKQMPGNYIRGLLYVDGACCIQGTVKGASYLRDCYYEYEGNKYPGVLYNINISREDIAYPMVLIGGYNRHEVKKVF